MTGSTSAAGGGSSAASGLSGLPVERTDLAWNRTALGVAGNAALLALHEFKTAGPAMGWAPAALALAIALATTLVGQHRTRILRRRPLPCPLPPTLVLPAIGYAIAALALLTGTVLIL